MTLKDFQSEYELELIGELIYQRVRLITERLLRRRDPVIYARGAHDYRDALGDVVNDFVVDVLIGERQIDYVMVTAADLADFDRLVGRQIRRYLGRTRVRTVVDNLIDRSVGVLRVAPFRSDGSGQLERFRLIAAAFDVDAVTTDAELRRAAALAQAIPKVKSNGDERAPKVYESTGLKAVLVIACESCSAPLSRSDLQLFFDDLLTVWTPSFLGPVEEQDLPAPVLDPDEEVLVNETVNELLASLGAEDRLILGYKYANLPDRELAAALNLSRQSTAPRKRALFARLNADLGPVPEHLRSDVLGRLNVLIASEGAEVT